MQVNAFLMYYINNNYNTNLKFMSGYRKFHLNSLKGYSQKILAHRLIVYLLVIYKRKFSIIQMLRSKTALNRPNVFRLFGILEIVFHFYVQNIFCGLNLMVDILLCIKENFPSSKGSVQKLHSIVHYSQTWYISIALRNL